MTCATCPGVSVLRTGQVCCSTWRRPDLMPVYGDGHPLRKLPDDGGKSCEWYAKRYGREKEAKEMPVAATESTPVAVFRQDVGKESLMKIKGQLMANAKGKR